jgi:TonB family protein
MNSFLLYLVQSSLALILFSTIYYFLFRKENNSGVNRTYLLATGLISLFLPFVKFNLSTSEAGKDFAAWLPAFTVGQSVKPTTPAYSATDYILAVYLIVAAILLCKFLYNIFHLLFIIIKNEKLKKNDGNIIITANDKSPYSFFKYIFLPGNKINSPDINYILAHELVHVKKSHSIDKLLVEFISIIQWFNPFVYLYKKELTAQHELSADSELIQQGTNIAEYMNSLLEFTVFSSANSLTNNYNSLLKRRLEMLNKTQTTSIPWLKVIFSIPLGLFIIVIAGIVNGGSSITLAKDNLLPELKINMSDVYVNSNAAPTLLEVQQSSSQKSKVKADNKEPYKIVDKMPMFPGGDEKLLNYLAQNIHYPAIAKKAAIQGRVLVNFTVTKSGKVKDVTVLKGIGGGCDEEAMRVVKSFPKWIPGKLKGVPVDVSFTLPIIFKLQ